MSVTSSFPPCIKIPTCSSSSSSTSSSTSFRFSSSKPFTFSIRNSQSTEGPLRRPMTPSSPPPPLREPSQPIKPSLPSQPPPQNQNSASVVLDDKNVTTLEFQRQKAKELQEYFKKKKLEEANQGPFFGFIAKNEISNGRNKKPTWKVMLLSFFTGLFGGNLLNNLFLEAEDLASATLVTAVYNLTPALTFIYSIFAGLETMSVQIAAGKAKLFGTVTGIGGCMLLTFLKGPKIIGVGTFGMNFIHKNSHAAAAAATHVSLIRKLLGLLASFGSSINFTAWLIIQSKISLQYPHTYSSAALMSVMGATQATIYAICVEKDWSVWHLTSPIKI